MSSAAPIGAIKPSNLRNSISIEEEEELAMLSQRINLYAFHITNPAPGVKPSETAHAIVGLMAQFHLCLKGMRDSGVPIEKIREIAEPILNKMNILTLTVAQSNSFMKADQARVISEDNKVNGFFEENLLTLKERGRLEPAPVEPLSWVSDMESLEIGRNLPTLTEGGRWVQAAMDTVQACAAPIEFVSEMVATGFKAQHPTTSRLLGEATQAVMAGASHVIPDAVARAATRAQERIELTFGSMGIPAEKTRKTEGSLVTLTTTLLPGVGLGRVARIGAKAKAVPKARPALMFPEAANSNRMPLPQGMVEQQARFRALSDCNEAIRKEMQLLDRLHRDSPSFHPPKGFPQYASEFRAFPKEPGYNLHYKVVDGHPVYLIDSSFLKRQGSSPFANWQTELIFTEGMALSLAERKGFKRVFLAWDPQKIPLLVLREAREYPTVAVYQMRGAANESPLAVAEILLKRD